MHKNQICIINKAVAAVAEAGVVVVRADVRAQAHAADDLRGVEPAGGGVGVELVEVGHAQRQVGVGEEFDGLGSHIIDGDNPAASALSL